MVLKAIALLFWTSVIYYNSFAQPAFELRKYSDYTDPIGTTYNDVWGYEQDGRRYAILGEAKSIHFVDITDPENPSLVYRYEDWISVIWRDFKTYNHYAYAVVDGGTSSIKIFDLQYLPDSVPLVAVLPNVSLSAHNIFIADDVLYCITNNRVNGGSAVDAFSLKDDPTNPQFIAALGGCAHDAFARNDTVYVSSCFAGLIAYKLDRELGRYVELGRIDGYPDDGYNHAGWLHESGDYFVFADETWDKALKLLKLTRQPDTLLFEVIDTISTLKPSIAHNPFIKGDSIYVSYYHHGIRVYDMTDPYNLEEVAYYDTYPDNPVPMRFSSFQGNWGIYPFFSDDVLIASDMKYGLIITSRHSPNALKGYSYSSPNDTVANTFQFSSDNPQLSTKSLLEIRTAENEIISSIDNFGYNTENSVDVSALKPGSYKTRIAEGENEIDVLPFYKYDFFSDIIEVNTFFNFMSDFSQLDTTGKVLITDKNDVQWYFNDQFPLKSNNSIDVSDLPFDKYVASISVGKSIYTIPFIKNQKVTSLGDIDVTLFPDDRIIRLENSNENKTEDLVLTMHDRSGKVLFEESLLVNSEAEVVYPILPYGYYFIKISTNSASETTPIILR